MEGYFSLGPCAALFAHGAKAYLVESISEEEKTELDRYKRLVNSGGDITKNNNAAVRLASKNGHLALVKYLVAQGADATAERNIAVCGASKSGHLALVKYLVSQGANIRANVDACVKLAFYSGNLKVVDYLLNNGATISPRIARIVIAREIKKGRLDIIKYLVSKGVNIASENNYALRAASAQGRLEIVKFLVTVGANNKTLMEAWTKGDFEQIKALISRSVSLADKDNKAIRVASSRGHLQIFKLLTSQSLIKVENINLLIAQIKEDYNRAREGLNARADRFKEEIKQGLARAEERHDEKMSERLRSALANNTGRNKQELISRSQIIKLLETYRDANMVEVNYDIALLRACKNGHLKMAMYLALQGVDIEKIGLATKIFIVALAKKQFSIVKYISSVRHFNMKNYKRLTSLIEDSELHKYVRLPDEEREARARKFMRTVYTLEMLRR